MTSTIVVSLLCVAAAYVALQNYETVEDAYLVNYTTSHRRFTPTSHSFSYPLTLALFKLEERCGKSRLFRESSRLWSLLRIDPQGYLTTSYSDLSIIANLRRTLRDRGYNETTAHSVYLMTMPTTLGMSNINPLSIYFCYDDKACHTLIIFEVHNTYGERSMYIIPNDDSTRTKSSEYTHESYQGRSFFVSPMNDRKGFYKLQASIPFDGHNKPIKPPKIRVTYYDEDEKLKFTANLMPSGDARKMSLRTILIHLATRPFNNLLTFARILYQALYLHYFKDLAFYPKPNIGATLNTKANPTQSLDESGSLGFDAESYLSAYARKAIEKSLRNAVRRHPHVRVVINYTDLLIPPTKIGSEEAAQTLTLNIRTYEFYTQMLISPNVDYIINVLGSRCEDMVRISDNDLFRDLLSVPKNDTTSIAAKLLAHLRRAHAKWILYQSPSAKINFDVSGVQSFDKPMGDGCVVLALVIAITIQFRLFAFAFTVLGVKFKPNQTPWKPIDRLQ